jgi:hypothetical protein
MYNINHCFKFDMQWKFSEKEGLKKGPGLTTKIINLQAFLVTFLAHILR